MDEDNVLNEWKENDENKFDKKSARKMVWRTRLSIGFTVIRTLLVIFFLYVLYFMPVTMYYDMSGQQAEFDRLITTLIETRYPGVEVDETHGANAEINPFLTQSTTIKLYRNVGEWDVVLGEVEAKKQLFGDANLTMNFDEKYLHDNMVHNFALPPELLENDSVKHNSESTGGLDSQLKKIDNGHVAQVQFSVKEAMKPEKLLKKLATYDVRVSRMPVYGGELMEFDDIPYSKSGQFTFVNSLLLRPQIIYDENNRVSSSVSPLNSMTLERSIDQFYKDIEWLVKNGNYNDRDLDKKRLDYIRENGVEVYGAVATGPIREIAKLMDEEQFHQFYLGGVEVWNWSKE